MFVALSLAAGLALVGADPSGLVGTSSIAPSGEPTLHSSRPHWPAWAGAGATILGLGLGVYYRAVAHEAQTEADRTTDMDTMTRDTGDAHDARVAATWLFAGSAAALVFTLFYFFWPEGQE